MLTLNEIGQALTGTSPPGQDTGPVLQDVVIDSRLASHGSLFVALPGERHDGHDFVGAAIANGALGALVQPRIRQDPPEGALLWEPAREARMPCTEGRPVCVIVPDTLEALQRIAAWRRRQRPNCRVIGITGSMGKTTTKELVATVVAQRYVTLKSPGNFNNEIGLPLTVLRIEASHQRAVLEMGMYALGEIAQLAEIALPDTGIVTNVQPIHLERLGSLERIAQAKAELVEALPPSGAAVLNGDDPLVRAMGDKTRARKLYYGLGRGNNLWADGIQSRGLEGISFCLHHGGESVWVETPLLGAHSVWTALAAAGVGVVEGLSWDEIVAGLGQAVPPVRMVVKTGPGGITILDDTYNANPVATIAALEFMATLPGRHVAVLGDMLELGSHEQEAHVQVGRHVPALAQRLITVGSRARTVAQKAQAEGMSAAHIYQADNNQEAVACLAQWLEPGDVVLVKGSRSMGMEEIVAKLQEGAP